MVSAQPAPAAVEPPDVLVRMEQIRDELESIRFVMGRPVNEQPEIGVTGAASREVYFQALTMLRKANRLCFEQTREHGDEPVIPNRAITSADVLDVLVAVLERLDLVKEALDIETRSQPPPRDPTKTPTDVFRAAVQANRQLNLLLLQGFTPSDVFQQVTLGVGYASRLLERFPSVDPIPPPPPFVVGQRPSAVYRRLLECFERTRQIARLSGLSMLSLEADDGRIAASEPSDVYDIASLLVSALAYLHGQLADAVPPREVYYVGPKFPSHVYQRAGILERQLTELEQQAERYPDWLATPPAS